VLFTQATMETAGGLPGMILTMSDPDEPMDLSLYGHTALQPLVDAMGTFISKSQLSKIGKSFLAQSSEQPLYADPSVAIHSVVLCAAGEHPAGPPAGGEGEAPGSEVRPPDAKRHKASHAPEEAALRVGGASDAVCYIAKLADIPGKFMPEKAAALNVPRGPAYARLVKGEEVESTDGKTVRPEQVGCPTTLPPLHTPRPSAHPTAVHPAVVQCLGHRLPCCLLVGARPGRTGPAGHSGGLPHRGPHSFPQSQHHTLRARPICRFAAQ